MPRSEWIPQPTEPANADSPAHPAELEGLRGEEAALTREGWQTIRQEALAKIAARKQSR